MKLSDFTVTPPAAIWVAVTRQEHELDHSCVSNVSSVAKAARNAGHNVLAPRDTDA